MYLKGDLGSFVAYFRVCQEVSPAFNTVKMEWVAGVGITVSAMLCFAPAAMPTIGGASLALRIATACGVTASCVPPVPRLP